MTTIKIKSGEASFGADTLLDCVAFISAQGVRYVDLTWTWNHVIELDCPNRCPFTHEGDIRARYIGQRVDGEYSYVGVFDLDTFTEFAKDYSCWDDAELRIIDGVLMGYIDGYDPDADEFPDSDESIDVLDWYELTLVAYEYWDSGARKWRELR